jgi:hypothetical protein
MTERTITKEGKSRSRRENGAEEVRVLQKGGHVWDIGDKVETVG